MTSSSAFPWARAYDADQLAAFIEDLWGAASGDNDLTTLDAIEKVVANHAPTPPKCPLTDRQMDVLIEAASGESCASAAANLGVSLETVKTIRADVCVRLNARNMTHASTIALHYGWLTGHRVPLPKPPPRGRGPIAGSNRHAERAAQLRQRPGVEAIVGDYGSRGTAYRAARLIPRGAFGVYEPAGAFRARAFLSPEQRWMVAATYVGTPTTGEGPQS
ncbi:helix-turn-helix transcriptional regulator [Streptomyces sp. NPDC044948]|uniref:response regulator transcription factor n=1 Tax=Streptomyces sp. NPDC044948 TaxID=3157092 RepID=UPI0033EB4185